MKLISSATPNPVVPKYTAATIGSTTIIAKANRKPRGELIFLGSDIWGVLVMGLNSRRKDSNEQLLKCDQ
jgi:hypothetical protein